MTTPRSSERVESFFTQDLLYAARYYLGGRRGLLIVAGVALLAGLALNWSWLVTAGIAPILISILPCAAMCALGLCMNRMGGKSCSTGASTPDPASALIDAAPTVRPSTQEVSPGPPTEPFPSGARRGADLQTRTSNFQGKEYDRCVSQ